MSDELEGNPKVKVAVIRSHKKNGDTYIQKTYSVYDPKIKNNRRIRTVTLGKLPPGETDLEKMIPIRQTKRRTAKEAEQISEPTEQIHDPREQSKVEYDLRIVVFVILLAAIEGKNSCMQISEFWKQNRKELSEAFKDFPASDISHDTVRRIIEILGRQKNAKLLQAYCERLRTRLAQPVIAVDGHGACAARNESNRVPYILNIMDTDQELMLVQRLIGAKENEITHASDLIKTLDIAGSIVTADALNTQVHFAETIIGQGADYCLAVKNNQKGLCEQIRGFFESGNYSPKFARPNTEDKQGYVTKRMTRILPGKLLPEEIRNNWPGLEEGCIVRAVTDSIHKKTKTPRDPVERWYITSLRYDAPNAAEIIHRAIRQHWTIENKGHWVLDVDFNQDRIHATNAAYLNGITQVNKVAQNFISKIMTKIEEKTGKEAPSRPVLREMLSRIPTLISHMSECFLR